jgi:hypothetical protein
MLRSLDSSFRKTHWLREFEIHFTAEATDQDRIHIFLDQNENLCRHLLTRERDKKPVAQARSVWQAEPSKKIGIN